MRIEKQIVMKLFPNAGNFGRLTFPCYVKSSFSSKKLNEAKRSRCLQKLWTKFLKSEILNDPISSTPVCHSV